MLINSRYLNIHTRKGFGWIMIFGYGITWKDVKIYGLTFSERYTRKKHLQIGRFRVSPLGSNDNITLGRDLVTRSYLKGVTKIIIPCVNGECNSDSEQRIVRFDEFPKIDAETRERLDVLSRKWEMPIPMFDPAKSRVIGRNIVFWGTSGKTSGRDEGGKDVG